MRAGFDTTGLRRFLALWALALPLGCDEPARGDGGPPPIAERSHREVLRELRESRGRIAQEGRWRRFRGPSPDEGLTEEESLVIRDLGSLGYASGTQRAPAESGVVRYVPGEAFEGLNLFTSAHAAEATLMDMKGRVVHTWRRDFLCVWPEFSAAQITPGMEYWRRVHLFENGDLLAIFDGIGIIKLDRQSNLVWANPCRAHHDLEVTDDGRIIVLTREFHVVPRIHPTNPINEDFITILDADGVEQDRISILECLERSVYMSPSIFEDSTGGDIFHTNTLALLDGRIADTLPAFAAGNLLISLRSPSIIAVIDPGSREFVWGALGSFEAQHDPKVLENGNLMLFDNRGLPGRSAVLEIDPGGNREAWSYRGTDEEPFYSKTCGAAERLPNGNTLVTESDNGRAFELTKDKRIVWEFLNPHRAGDEDEYIATLFEVLRVGLGTVEGWRR